MLKESQLVSILYNNSTVSNLSEHYTKESHSTTDHLKFSMAPFTTVSTASAPKPLPQFSQAVKYNGTVFTSGNIGWLPETSTMVEGGIKEQTVSDLSRLRIPSTFVGISGALAGHHCLSTLKADKSKAARS